VNDWRLASRITYDVALVNREEHRGAWPEIERNVIGNDPTGTARDLFSEPPVLDVLVPDTHKLDILSSTVTEQPACIDNPRKVSKSRNVVDRRHDGILTLKKRFPHAVFTLGSPKFNIFAIHSPLSDA